MTDAIIEVPDVKVPGVVITLSGEMYTLPPLPLVHMAKISALMKGGEMNDEFIGALVSAIHLSLVRNYPELKKEAVESSVDMLNWKEVLDAFMKTNGFAPLKGGAGLGEVPGVASPSPT